MQTDAWANAQQLFRHGARVFVAGPVQFQGSSSQDATLAASAKIKKEYPAVVTNISMETHPVRPLHVQPVNGYTYTSPISRMLPFWSHVPTPSFSGGVDPAVFQEAEPAVHLSAVIPRFNADTFWDALLMSFQLSLGVDVGKSLATAILSGEVVLSYVFFGTLIMLGNWVLFNCFIATMIVSFRREAVLLEETKRRQEPVDETGKEPGDRHTAAIIKNKAKFMSRIERMAVDGRSAQEVMATIINLSTYKKKERMKSGELLAQALMSRQAQYEEDLESVTREEHRAMGAKNAALAERCRQLKRYITDTLKLLDDGVMVFYVKRDCYARMRQKSYT